METRYSSDKPHENAYQSFFPNLMQLFPNWMQIRTSPTHPRPRSLYIL